jgi:SGNH hydrolase-like domain, acetyltransferase AlgX
MKSGERAAKAVIAVVSAFAGLCLAEGLVRLWDGDAFPYLNLFVADSEYGVRLRPNATARTRSRSRRVTEIRTNSLGFRGPEWPPAEHRILVVGDSQMMGYGVDWPETLAPALERELGGGVAVLDAAVPSWGPMEYARAVEEWVARLHPREVLFVANVANDWLEAGVPNRVRTGVRDGWAAAPNDHIRDFPGRQWLLGRSHLVFAARELLHAVHAGDEGLPANTALRLAGDLPKLLGNRSRLAPALERAARACEHAGCRLIAVALPLDVQVSPREWRKYRAAARDVGPTEALQRQFLDEARALGLVAVDLLPPLRAAEPGAFLDDDYHLSPRGHQACARALARAIQTEVTRR